MLYSISSLPGQDWERTFPRTVCLLGSTGSIGLNALRVIAAHPELFSVVALAAGRNVERLAEQAERWRPAWLAVQDTASATALAERLAPLAGYRPEILVGQTGYARLAALSEVSTVLSAQVGAAALRGTLAAAQAGKVICLANKESLVLAGHLVRDACRKSGAVVLPVDSEHNALFQALRGRDPQTVRTLVLTASGGPFRGKSREELRAVTSAQALRHPNWNMGAKITVDSATMMNKGLEVIEAWHLYGVPGERIAVLVHPQSIVHSLVEFEDGSHMAHLGTPDMRVPIAYCLAWPRALDTGVAPLRLADIKSLTFEEPDVQSFPCLDLARQVLAGQTPGQGSAAAVALNAANEVAVEAFLQGRIGFLDIPDRIAAALDACSAPDPATLEDIEALDHETRRFVGATIE